MFLAVLSPAQTAIRAASIISVFIAIAVALLLYFKHRHKAMLLYAAFMGCSLYIGTATFLGSIGWQQHRALRIVIGATVAPIVAGLCISLPCFVFSLLELTPPRPLRWLVWLPVPALLVALGILIATQMNQGAAACARVINQTALLGFIWFFVEWIACCILVIARFRLITQKEVRQGLLGMAIVMVAWIPFWSYEVLNHRPTMSPYYFALIWSALSLFLATRYFFQPQSASVALPASPGPLADGPMVDRFAETRKLTPRERELCTLLVEGLNHAAIAQRLFISEKTVRNHVSNIYAKVNVSSLMELIRAIREA